MYGKNYQKIAEFIKTRDRYQTNNYTKKVLKVLTRNQDQDNCNSLLKIVNDKPYLYQLHWTNSENDKFIEGLEKFGKNWKKISKWIGTKNSKQTLHYG